MLLFKAMVKKARKGKGLEGMNIYVFEYVFDSFI